jgi:hypothetical protein
MKFSFLFPSFFRPTLYGLWTWMPGPWMRGITLHGWIHVDPGVSYPNELQSLAGDNETEVGTHFCMFWLQST